jgi:hypothetical protein
MSFEFQISRNPPMKRLLASLLLVMTLAPINNTALAQQRFDGHWSVEAVPEKGPCRRTHHYAVVIENGAVRNAGREKVSVAGGLEASGNIRGTIQRNKTRVNVTGNLSERSGSGDWSITGRASCSGRWRAEKRR